MVSLAYYLRVLVELYMHAPDTGRIEAAAAELPAQSTGDEAWPARTRMPLAATVGVLLAAATLVLAFLPQQVFDAGCDARSALLSDAGACTQVAAAQDRGQSVAPDAGAAATSSQAPALPAAPG